MGGASAAHALGFHSDRGSGGADLDQSDQKLPEGRMEDLFVVFSFVMLFKIEF